MKLMYSDYGREVREVTDAEWDQHVISHSRDHVAYRESDQDYNGKFRLEIRLMLDGQAWNELEL